MKATPVDPSRRRLLYAALGAGVLGVSTEPLRAAPAAPSIRLVVPFARGGTTDLVARTVAGPLGTALGQRVVVENVSGAGGAVGAMEVVRAAPDGLTLGMATVSTTAARPAIDPSTPYDPTRDFEPVASLAATPNLIAVHPSFPATHYRAFVDLLRRSPGQYSYASSGTGGMGHLMTELYKSLTGVYMAHIPYRGAGPALADVVAGQVPIIFDNLPSAMPFVRDGRLVPIVVAAPQRLAAMPHVPTFHEVGLDAVNRMAYYGLVAPRGTPKEFVERVHSAVDVALADPGLRQRVDRAGALITTGGPEEFGALIRAELAVYRKVVAQQGLTL